MKQGGISKAVIYKIFMYLKASYSLANKKEMETNIDLLIHFFFYMFIGFGASICMYLMTHMVK